MRARVRRVIARPGLQVAFVAARSCSAAVATRAPGDNAGQSRAAVDAYDIFMQSPSPALACRALEQLDDPARGWAVFRRVNDAGDWGSSAFFHAMMAFCQRYLPDKAPDVLDACLDRGVAVHDALFCTFLKAAAATCCQTSGPPPVVEQVVERYRQCGLRSHNAIFGVANLCRVARRPRAALFLVGDAVDNDVAMSEKLASVLAACCAEAKAAREEAADGAQRLLDLMVGHACPYRNQPLFANLFKALLLDGRFDAVLHALDAMDRNGLPPSVHIWTLVLAALARADRPRQALDAFRAMRDRRVDVDAPVFCLLVAACGRARDAAAVADLHRHASDRSMLGNDFVRAALIAAFAACDAIATAEDLFRARVQQQQAGADADVVFTAMLSAYSRRGLVRKAVAAYAFVGLLGVRRTRPLYTTILSALTKDNRLPQAMDVFRAMQDDGVAVDNAVLTRLIATSGRCSDVDAVRALHAYATANDRLGDGAVGAALITAFAHAGELGASQRVFDVVVDDARRPPDVAPFNAMMAAFGHQGLCQQAADAYQRLKSAGLRPTPATLRALLVGCSRAGQVARADAVLAEFAAHWPMDATSSSSSSPARDVHRLLIDLHARVGNVVEVERLAVSAPVAAAVAWDTVLLACRAANDVARAERIFAYALSLGDLLPSDTLARAYDAMLGVYTCGAGRAGDADRLRREMRARRISVDPGRTSLFLPGRTVQLVDDDVRCRRDPLVRHQHDLLVGRLPAANGSPRPDHPTSQPDVSRHSEVIAVAYAMRRLTRGEPIRMLKNVPVRPDGHDALKRASRVLLRPIFVRDTRAHHQFRDGRCSCGDHW